MQDTFPPCLKALSKERKKGSFAFSNFDSAHEVCLGDVSFLSPEDQFKVNSSFQLLIKYLKEVEGLQETRGFEEIRRKILKFLKKAENYSSKTGNICTACRQLRTDRVFTMGGLPSDKRAAGVQV